MSGQNLASLTSLSLLPFSLPILVLHLERERNLLREKTDNSPFVSPVANSLHVSNLAAAGDSFIAADEHMVRLSTVLFVKRVSTNYLDPPTPRISKVTAENPLLSSKMTADHDTIILLQSKFWLIPFIELPCDSVHERCLRKSQQSKQCLLQV
jgi:hypothetical protein